MISNKIEDAKCVVCGKKFIKYKKGLKSKNSRAMAVRPCTTKTCSKKCSRIYIFNYLKNRNKRK